ncbi:NUDIX domain-containing protein [Zhongshania aquimaris]|uniref:GDP-mannose pyrophosphatase n=1 Tax=Zhongshania aquimaris TaxID=2857107 RepID=A0ABS6VW85_9GAMM|nr:NUDIX hydrolase [Zhongshania aquimaris]MBW2942573.1 NUDIX hydrolase [Zhongshania aquimaris]
MTKKLGPWQQVSRQVVYENPWLRLEHHEVKTPAGTDGIYGKICFQSVAVGVIPIDDEGNTFLVKQYRYTLEEDSWEIPEGGCPLGSSPLLTASRELAEETGLSAKRWAKLMDLHTSNSVTDERAEVFLAMELVQGDADLEASEHDIEVCRLPLGEAIAMALDGRITDAISVSALLKLQILLHSAAGDLRQVFTSLSEEFL